MPGSYERFALFEKEDKFYLQPRDNGDNPIGNQCLVLDRVSGAAVISPDAVLPKFSASRNIYGVFGVVPLIAGKYLIIIEKREVVALINQEKIYKITGVDILSYTTPSRLVLADELVIIRIRGFSSFLQKRENDAYFNLIKSFVGINSFYFSPNYDLTHTVQYLQDNGNQEFMSKSIFQRANPDFVWNKYLLADLEQTAGIEDYLTPVMLGFVKQLKRCRIGETEFQVTLISRRSVRRAGARFHVRGVDDEGATANTIETEQILEYLIDISSFVQIRGSVPVIWCQKPSIHWSPRILVDFEIGGGHAERFRRHCDYWLKKYDRLILISLLSKKKHEEDLAELYNQVCRNIGSNIQLIEFDFNEKCKGARWDALEDLLQTLELHLAQCGYFLYKKGKAVADRNQKSVFRTNCVDSLDRTNVVQTLISCKMLERQMKAVGILSDSERIYSHINFEGEYRRLWADNGDNVSEQYAGTSALKADFVRYRTRTVVGELDDLRKTCYRWWINNFCDGSRQDSYDFMLGHYPVDHENPMKYSLHMWKMRHYVWLAIILLIICYVASHYCSEMDWQYKKQHICLPVTQRSNASKSQFLDYTKVQKVSKNPNSAPHPKSVFGKLIVASMAFIPPCIFPDTSVQSVELNVINLDENRDSESELANLETLHKEKVNFVVKQYADVIPAGKSHISDKDNEDEDDDDIEDDDEFESADVEDLEEIDAQALYADEPDASAVDTNRPPRPPV